jgi:hypothetical protein
LRSHSGHSERLSPKVAAEEAEEVVAAEAEVQEAQAVARLGPEQEQPELDRPVQDKLAVMRGKCDPARGPDHQVHRARQGPVRTISAIRERRAQKLGPTTLARGGADVAYRDQSQNPFGGRPVSPIERFAEGTRRVSSFMALPRWGARLIGCRCSLASIPEGLAEMSGLATGRGGSFGC